MLKNLKKAMAKRVLITFCLIAVPGIGLAASEVLSTPAFQAGDAAASLAVSEPTEFSFGAVALVGLGAYAVNELLLEDSSSDSSSSSSTSSGGSSSTGSYKFFCNVSYACVNYTINSLTKYNEVKAGCGGTSGDRHGCATTPIGCRHDTSFGTMWTYVKEGDAATIDASCRANGGTVL